MKQLEQEKDTLLQGLETAEHLRDWYHKQIAGVTEKQNYVEKTSCSVSTVELQWHEHLWDHENMFETGVVRANGLIIASDKVA